jgi:hypothetical protein
MISAINATLAIRFVIVVPPLRLMLMRSLSAQPAQAIRAFLEQGACQRPGTGEGTMLNRFDFNELRYYWVHSSGDLLSLILRRMDSEIR